LSFLVLLPSLRNDAIAIGNHGPCFGTFPTARVHQLANDYLETTLAAIDRACSDRCQIRATDMKDSKAHEQVLYLVSGDCCRSEQRRRKEMR
jgi:hypothetical protein